jgi:hypothetical protein
MNRNIIYVTPIKTGFSSPDESSAIVIAKIAGSLVPLNRDQLDTYIKDKYTIRYVDNISNLNK